MSRKYQLICAGLCVIAIVSLIVGCSKSKKASSDTKPSVKTSTLPAPTYQETDDSKKVPNPCDVLSIEHVAGVLTQATIRGPLVQSTVVLSKTCEWSTTNKQYPKLGVSIILSPTFYSASEAEKIDDAKVGDKAFVVKKYVTSIGGTSCGRTIMVSYGQFAYSVAACLAENKAPSTKQLVELATDVKNSLPEPATTTTTTVSISK